MPPDEHPLPPVIVGKKAVNKKFNLLAVVGIAAGAVVLIVGLLLVVDDLRVYGQGGKSIIGEVIGKKSPNEVIEIGAWQLFEEYAANEIRADNTFRNRTVIVSGYVTNIGKDVLGQPYVVLASGELFGAVQCMLSRSATEQALALDQGQIVTLAGTVSGKTMNVVVTDCSFTKASHPINLVDPTTTSQLEGAAASGDIVASRRLGERYWDGFGVPIDKGKGLKFLRFAAEHGELEAQTFLGAIYAAGNGVAQDHAEASKWNTLAAEKGDAVAQYNLALGYLKGQGVPENRNLGIDWLRKSAAQRNTMARDLLSKIEQARER